MEKYNILKLFLLLLMILTTDLLYAQIKPIELKTGNVVFSKESKITDSVAFKKSLDEFVYKFTNGLKEEFTNENNLDSSKLNESIKMIKNLLLNSMFQLSGKTMNVNSYGKDKIVYYQLINGQKDKDLYYYDRAKNDVYNSFDGEPIVDYFKQENILEVKEYKQQTKNILGNQCFKVVYTYREQPEEEMDFMPQITYSRELWVTNYKSSQFHSVIKSPQILSKYYPLKIAEKMLGINGFETIYTVERIEL